VYKHWLSVNQFTLADRVVFSNTKLVKYWKSNINRGHFFGNRTYPMV